MRDNGHGARATDIAVLKDGEEEEEGRRRDRKLWKAQRRPKETQALIVELPIVVSAEKLPEKKEVVNEMKDKTPTVRTAPAPEICPICGFDKSAKLTENGQTKKGLICDDCGKEYDQYVDRTTDAIVAGGKPEMLDEIEWIHAQLNLALFDGEHKRALKDRDDVHEWAVVKADADARKLNKAMPQEILSSLIAKYEERERPGRQSRVMRMWSRLQAARKLKPKLEQMIVDKKATAIPAETAVATIPTIKTTEPIPVPAS